MSIAGGFSFRARRNLDKQLTAARQIGSGSEADLEPHWNRFLATVAVQPIGTSGSSMSYRDAMLSDCDGLTVSQCRLPGQTPDAALVRTAMAASSDFFDAALPDAGIQALLQAIRNRLASGKRGAVLLNH
jgi:hypothetical protein